VDAIQRPTTDQPVLSVRNLETIFRGRHGDVYAVNNVNFDVMPGEIIGIVGESGSGKSVTMMSLLKLLPSPPADIHCGRVLFNGTDLLKVNAKALRAVRGGKIGFVFQDPMTTLNPVLTIGTQLMEPLQKHMGLPKAAARKHAHDLLKMVGIPDAERRLGDFPHQFSGGMRQRVVIAMALACGPELLIADEPTTALDVTIQAQILKLIRDLQKRLGMAVIWITHDLGVVARIADRVMVFYGGQIVEQARVKDLFSRPAHPYTRALLKTVPSLRGERVERLSVIEGQPPILNESPKFCVFLDRCSLRCERCARENPVRNSVGPDHDAACFVTAPMPEEDCLA